MHYHTKAALVFLTKLLPIWRETGIEMGKTTVIYLLYDILHCCYAAGTVTALLGLANAGSSIPQHRSSSPAPPAMLLGCLYCGCTAAMLPALHCWGYSASHVAVVKRFLAVVLLPLIVFLKQIKKNHFFCMLSLAKLVSLRCWLAELHLSVLGPKTLAHPAQLPVQVEQGV